MSEEDEYIPVCPIEEFLWASRSGDLDSMKELLRNGMILDVNVSNEDGCTALHMACANGHTSVISFLLNEVNAKLLMNHHGNNPLHWAIQNNQLEAIKLLTAAISNRRKNMQILSDKSKYSSQKRSETAPPVRDSTSFQNGLSSENLVTSDSVLKAANGISPTGKLPDEISIEEDVLLQKNNAGKTPLGEAFGTEDMEIINLLLDASTEDNMHVESSESDAEEDSAMVLES